jgi:hypothetical protein
MKYIYLNYLLFHDPRALHSSKPLLTSNKCHDLSVFIVLVYNYRYASFTITGMHCLQLQVCIVYNYRYASFTITGKPCL